MPVRSGLPAKAQSGVRDRQVGYFTEYVKTYTDAPFLVTLTPRGDGYIPGRFLTAADIGDTGDHQPY